MTYLFCLQLRSCMQFNQINLADILEAHIKSNNNITDGENDMGIKMNE